MDSVRSDRIPVALKILIAGGFGAGKTTMVGSVSEIRPLQTEEVLTAAEGHDDTSGVEGEWWPFERAMAGAPRDLLALAGELYLPFLTANERAWSKGLERLEMRVWELDYTLAPFKYQVKCLATLRERFGALDADSQARLEPILRETGCWPHLVRQPSPDV